MPENQYGDFEEVKEELKQQVQEEQQIPVRARLPRQGQLIGIVLQRLGGKRMSVKTTDNKIRNCRVPGKFRKKFWLREGNIIMIVPWPDDNEKGDVVYQYKPGEIIQLKKRGLLNSLERKF